jgi:DNA-binding IclR family transcriptional regulator
VLLAYAPIETQEEFFSRAHLMRHTDHTIASGDALRLELRTVRRCGFAFDDQEEELNARCLAVPVLNRLGQVTASLGLCGSVRQIQDDNARTLYRSARHAAQSISCR